MRPIIESRAKPAEYVRIVRRIHPEAGTTLEDLQRPEYWNQIKHLIQPCELLEILPDDMAYYAEALVMGVGPTGAIIKVLSCVDLDGPVAKVPGEQEYDVQWKGPHHKWCVVRLSDKEIIEKGLAQKGEGVQRIKNMTPKAA